MSARKVISPEDCPVPELHGTFRHCPECSWMEPQGPRWERLMAVLRDAAREFAALPDEEKQLLRAHYQQAEEAGFFAINFRGSEPA